MDDKALEQVVVLRRQTRSTADLTFMSGRWRRRDGNVYGNVAAYKRGTQDADRPAGDIRPPNQR